jgi:hypothetical protein
VPLLRTRCDCLTHFKKVADSGQMHSVSMGDVIYQDKVENNPGVVMGHAYSTATDGFRITGSTNVGSSDLSDMFTRILKVYSTIIMAYSQVVLGQLLDRNRARATMAGI